MRKVTVEALEYVLDRDVTAELTLAERIILITLAAHAEREKTAPWRWRVELTGEQLSDASGVSLRHTSQATKQLIEKGLVGRVQATQRTGGRWFVLLFGPKP